jgi:hypothetical protein
VKHSILSDDARTLLGTIYMPRGRLIVDATKPIADRFAYTAMVVQQLTLYDGPNSGGRRRLLRLWKDEGRRIEGCADRLKRDGEQGRPQPTPPAGVKA